MFKNLNKVGMLYLLSVCLIKLIDEFNILQ